MSQVVRLRGISKEYVAPDGSRIGALRGVDLTLAAGDFLVVVGHNGSGKSTLLRIISGELVPDPGGVMEGITNGVARVADRSGPVVMLEQHPGRNLVRTISVAENLALAQLPVGTLSWTRLATSGTRESNNRILAEVGLQGKQAQLAGELSHGQQQLLALQMALVRNPVLTLLDEPTAALDRANARQVLRFIVDAHRRVGGVTVMVTHDLSMALHTGNRVCVMRDGCVAAMIGPEEKATMTLDRLSEMCGYLSMAEE